MPEGGGRESPTRYPTSAAPGGGVSQRLYPAQHRGPTGVKIRVSTEWRLIVRAGPCSFALCFSSHRDADGTPHPHRLGPLRPSALLTLLTHLEICWVSRPVPDPVRRAGAPVSHVCGVSFCRINELVRVPRRTPFACGQRLYSVCPIPNLLRPGARPDTHGLCVLPSLSCVLVASWSPCGHRPPHQAAFNESQAQADQPSGNIGEVKLYQKASVDRDRAVREEYGKISPGIPMVELKARRCPGNDSQGISVETQGLTWEA
ncbi:Sensor protein ChvG [Frankliniella fusca]|uniref:Sensor protein ChvG n=1 Tax=Frankliniella fusca TaxID=407009 RepID=A0AAE1L9X9_9NEOP|nr:Sensor protein ChvG [Frankliniella fusca]